MSIITKNILTGSKENPDYFFIVKKDDGRNGLSETSSFGTSKRNLYGYIPAVSTVLSLIRGPVALIYSLFHMVMSRADAKNKTMHLKQVKLGKKNIIRAAGEFFPLIGNFALLYFDNKKGNEIWKNKVNKDVQENPQNYQNKVTYFAGSKKAGSISIPNFNNKSQKKYDDLTDSEKIKIIIEKA